MKRADHGVRIRSRRRERRRLQALVIGLSAVMAAPSVLRAVGPADGLMKRPAVIVDQVLGPFASVPVPDGVATGAALVHATPGMRIAWIVRCAASGATTADLETRLARQGEKAAVAWSRQHVRGLSADMRDILFDQALPADLPAGRYQLSQDLLLSGDRAVRVTLPALRIDVTGGPTS